MKRKRGVKYTNISGINVFNKFIEFLLAICHSNACYCDYFGHISFTKK